MQERPDIRGTRRRRRRSISERVAVVRPAERQEPRSQVGLGFGLLPPGPKPS